MNLVVATVIAISTPNIAVIAQRLKWKMEFTDEAKADFDKFYATSPDECQLYLMAVTLQTWDLLQTMKTFRDTWEISKGLWKNISLYIKEFLLSSMAVCYVRNSSYQVMVALQDMNMRDLPAEDNMTGNAVLQSWISACLMTKHLQIKDAVNLPCIYTMFKIPAE
ncbi:hypothetical protein EDD85DRAFT_961394 [Armillaria nabsnona]|nr:hypothetical protein EDD85DRAFT_961394 [Armillaria nabsnona]